MTNKTKGLFGAVIIIMLAVFFAGCGEKKPVVEETIYTLTSPGLWKGKEAAHVPTILVGKTETGLEVQVSVNHEMDPDTPHYIMWIKLLDENDALLGETEFEPDGDSPTVTFSISDGPTKLKALEKCNLHGVWSAEIVLD